MPNAIKSIGAGICDRCGQAYNLGDLLTYSIKRPGERYHFPSCIDAVLSGAAHAAPIAPIAPIAATAPVHTPSVEPVAVAPVAAIPALAEHEYELTEHELERLERSALIAARERVAAKERASCAPPIAGPAKPIKSLPASKVRKNSQWWDVLDGVIDAGLTRILLVGPPGTGKSTTADRDGHRVTCHEDSGPESMVGTFIQKDGNTVWIDGPCTLAMRQGSRIVLDEIDHSSPECISLLYALLDDAPSIILPTGECVKAAKGYQVIGTSNGSPADFPEAIFDRLEGVIVADVPHPAAVAMVAGAECEQAKKIGAVMANFYKAQSSDAYNFRGAPTLRKCRNLARLLAGGLREDVAATVVFGKAGMEILSAMTTAEVTA